MRFGNDGGNMTEGHQRPVFDDDLGIDRNYKI